MEFLTVLDTIKEISCNWSEILKKMRQEVLFSTRKIYFFVAKFFVIHLSQYIDGAVEEFLPWRLSPRQLLLYSRPVMLDTFSSLKSWIHREIR